MNQSMLDRHGRLAAKSAQKALRSQTVASYSGVLSFGLSPFKPLALALRRAYRDYAGWDNPLR